MFLAGLYRSEQAIAERLRLLCRGRPPWSLIDAVRAIPWVEGRTGLALAPSQRKALTLAVDAKVLVITGGPGVGKTTLVNSVLKVLGAKGVRVELCAPTGRTAKRLAESIGLEARTIHRLLEIDPGWPPDHAPNSSAASLLGMGQRTGKVADGHAAFFPPSATSRRWVPPSSSRVSGPVAASAPSTRIEATPRHTRPGFSTTMR